MPRREEPEVSVTLEECHWRAIVEMIVQVCRARGGAWLLWGRSISSVIDAAIEGARYPREVSSSGAFHGHDSEPLRRRNGSWAYGEIGDQGLPVVIRRGRAQAMICRGRKGTIAGKGRQYVFQVQTTEEFRAGKWPLDQDDGYHGWIEIGPDDEIVAGGCDCPDNEEGRAMLSNGVVYCKHIGWANLTIADGEVKEVERLPVTLILGWDVNGQREALVAVRNKGRLREPRRNETVATLRERLVKDGYRLKRTVAADDGFVHQVYA